MELGDVGEPLSSSSEVISAVRARSTAPESAGSVSTKMVGTPCSRMAISSCSVAATGEAASSIYSQRLLILTAPLDVSTCGAPRASALSASRMICVSF